MQRYSIGLSEHRLVSFAEVLGEGSNAELSNKQQTQKEREEVRQKTGSSLEAAHQEVLLKHFIEDQRVSENIWGRIDFSPTTLVIRGNRVFFDRVNNAGIRRRLSTTMTLRPEGYYSYNTRGEAMDASLPEDAVDHQLTEMLRYNRADAIPSRIPDPNGSGQTVDIQVHSPSVVVRDGRAYFLAVIRGTNVITPLTGRIQGSGQDMRCVDIVQHR